MPDRAFAKRHRLQLTSSHVPNGEKEVLDDIGIRVVAISILVDEHRAAKFSRSIFSLT